MKKQTVLPLLAFLAICMAACNKNNYESSGTAEEVPSLRIRPPRYSTQTLVDSSGSIHNAVLETLYNGSGGYQSQQEFAHYLATTANNKLVADYEFDPLPKSYLQSGELDVMKLMGNNYYLLQKRQMDSIMNGTIDKLVSGPFIDNDEKMLFDQSRHIFDVNAAAPEQSVFDSIIARASRLQVTYNAHSWPEDEGVAIGGFLNIAKSSAEFWKSRQAFLQSSRAILPPWIKAWGFPQFDAAGYIYGWFKAWLWDELPTEKMRIGAGFKTAAEWSGISGWFK